MGSQGCSPFFTILVSAVFAIALTALAFAGTLVVNLAPRSCSVRHYTEDPSHADGWNYRYRKWLAPPGKGYGETGSCGSTVNFENWDELPESFDAQGKVVLN